MRIKRTLGLANQVIDLKVASLLIRSTLSQGLHKGASAEETCSALTLLLSVGSTSANADSGLSRFLPLDGDGICITPHETGELSIKIQTNQ